MPTIAPDATRSVIDAVALLLLATAISSVLLQRLDAYIRLIVIQGLLLSGAAAAVALGSGEIHTYAALIVTFAIKPVAVPIVLSYALRHIKIKREVETVVSHKVGFVLACGLVLLAYYVSAPLASLGGGLTKNALPAAISLLLLGLFTMATRRKALTQVVALVMMENGVYFAAVVATRGLPLAVELGAAADILVGVIVMGLVTRQLQRTFDTIDTDHLQALRG
jgi:hydrogenase-4 component E